MFAHGIHGPIQQAQHIITSSRQSERTYLSSSARTHRKISTLDHEVWNNPMERRTFEEERFATFFTDALQHEIR